MPDRYTKESLRRLAETISGLRSDALDNASRHAAQIGESPEESRFSMANLLHYLALRQHDLRPLQEELSRLGLSSLGRLEAHVDAGLCAVLCALHRVGRIAFQRPDDFSAMEAFEQGDHLLAGNAQAILGPGEPDRRCRIMVTLPSEAAAHPTLLTDLVAAGMNIVRINCAHDGPDTWAAMVRNLREAEAATGRRCRIAFDLAGPKLRTGPMRPGPSVFRWKPQRDELGRVVHNADVRFVPDPGDPASVPAGAIPVDPAGFTLFQPGTRLHLEDTRGRQRELIVVEADESRAVATCDHTGYVSPGTRIQVVRDGQDEEIGQAVIAPFPPLPGAIDLHPGDVLEIRRGREEGHVETRSGQRLPVISCDFDPLFSDCRPGEPILFDDGVIAGVIRERHPDRLEVEILRVTKSPARLRAEKGINVPASQLRAGALTTKDLQDLRVVAPLADMISLSFVREPGDVKSLVDELERIGAPDVGIVLKIENRTAFENLAAILLAALRHPPVAVMIARGDLGVEVGFERMAEIQEEMLWLCEAAHVPVIWATQVLESLSQRGMATRAEVTDAAMSGRAECVMLNKGPYIVTAVRTLSDILSRMEDHQDKKSARMRPLSVAIRDMPGSGTP